MTAFGRAPRGPRRVQISAQGQAKRTPSPRQPVNLTTNGARVGLSALFDFASLPANSVVHTQRWVNPGATNHPVFIIGLSGDKKYSYVLQTTSFGGTSLEDKYPDPEHPVRRAYIALAMAQATYPSDVSVLEITGQMSKQSWLNVNSFFVVETASLVEMWSSTVCLTPSSVDKVHSLVRDVLNGVIPTLPSKPSRPIMPLHIRDFKPHDLYIPSAPPSTSTQRGRTVRNATTTVPASSGNRWQASRNRQGPCRAPPANLTMGQQRNLNASWR